MSAAGIAGNEQLETIQFVVGTQKWVSMVVEYWVLTILELF